jgi:hypothetical protein
MLCLLFLFDGIGLVNDKWDEEFFDWTGGVRDFEKCG